MEQGVVQHAGAEEAGVEDGPHHGDAVERPVVAQVGRHEQRPQVGGGEVGERQRAGQPGRVVRHVVHVAREGRRGAAQENQAEQDGDHERAERRHDTPQHALRHTPVVRGLLLCLDRCNTPGFSSCGGSLGRGSCGVLIVVVVAPTAGSGGRGDIHGCGRRQVLGFVAQALHHHGAQVVHVAHQVVHKRHPQRGDAALLRQHGRGPKRQGQLVPHVAAAARHHRRGVHQHGPEEEQRRQQLREVCDVRHRLDVHGVHGEQQAAHERGPRVLQHSARQLVHHAHHAGVRQEAGAVEHGGWVPGQRAEQQGRQRPPRAVGLDVAEVLAPEVRGEQRPQPQLPRHGAVVQALRVVVHDATAEGFGVHQRHHSH